jgi:hypothetical protein
MDLKGEISWVTTFTLWATAQATLVYITFEIFMMVPVWMLVHPESRFESFP